MSKSKSGLEPVLHQEYRGFPHAGLPPAVFGHDQSVYSQDCCRAVMEAKDYELRLVYEVVKLALQVESPLAESKSAETTNQILYPCHDP